MIETNDGYVVYDGDLGEAVTFSRFLGRILNWRDDFIAQHGKFPEVVRLTPQQVNQLTTDTTAKGYLYHSGDPSRMELFGMKVEPTTSIPDVDPDSDHQRSIWEE